MRATARDTRKVKRNRLVLFSFLLILFIGSAGSGFAVDYETAVKLEQSGNSEEAIEAYRALLITKTDYYCSAALRLVGLLGDIQEKRKILAEALRVCTDHRGRHTVLRQLARLEEIFGNFKTAQGLYQQASFAIPDDKDFHSLLSSALLLFELGEYRGAEAQARAILETGRSDEVKEAAEVLLSRVYFATEREQKSLQTATRMLNSGGEGLAASSFLWILEVAMLVGDEALAERAREMLDRVYPGSSESALAVRTVNYLPSPSIFIGLRPASGPDESREDLAKELEPNGNVSVQTGSYSVHENAEYAVKDLEKAGFDATIKEIMVGETLYYRVVINGVTEDNVDSIILHLKQKSFEGFRIFE